jgi:hypothetical protein
MLARADVQRGEQLLAVFELMNTHLIIESSELG